MPEQTGAVQFVGGDESIERRMEGCPTPKKCSRSMNGPCPGQHRYRISRLLHSISRLYKSVHTRLCALTHVLPYAYHTYNYIIPMNMNPTRPSYSNNIQLHYSYELESSTPSILSPPIQVHYSHEQESSESSTPSILSPPIQVHRV